ncbi:MAG TPA: sugar phosphate isomerase/epimerase [Erysipelotrichaceae bacterium]|nr:sugar phosphate isomerase/epimerase [Erysipelotrichaceae bacterium]
MSKARIGVQAMMLKGKFDELGAYKTLKKVSEIGYNTIEISQIKMTEENVSEMKRAMEDFGMSVVAMSPALEGHPAMPQENLEDDYDKIVADAKTLNCEFFRIGMLPIPSMFSLEKVLEFCEKLEKTAIKLQGDGIKLYYHNHHVEFQKYDGKYLLDIIREHAPSVGFELDVHWVQRAGEDPVKVIEKYAGLVDLIHLKDYRVGAVDPGLLDFLAKGDFKSFMAGFNDIIEFAEVGEGNLDFHAIIEAGLASGAKHFLVEQDDTYGKDAFESLKISYDNLVEMGYGDMF